MNIELDSSDYVINKNIENIIKVIPSLGLPIILTPHKSQSSNINFVQEVYKKNKTGYIKITPKEFIYKNLSSKYILIEDIHLMEHFGYSEYLKKIKRNGTYFIFLNSSLKDYSKYSNSVINLNLDRYCINCNKEDVFVYLYEIYNTYKNIVIICKNINKITAFCNILDIECIITDTYLSKYTDKICLVIDKYIDISIGKVIYIGFDLKLKRLNININKINKSYRIRNLYKYLTYGNKNIKKEYFK